MTRFPGSVGLYFAVLGCVAGCGARADMAKPLTQQREVHVRTLAYHCAGEDLLVILVGENATVMLADRGLTLVRDSRRDDLATTENFSDGSSHFWLSDQSAGGLVGDRTIRDCQSRPQLALLGAAQLRGSDYVFWDPQRRWSLTLRREDQLNWQAELTEPAVGDVRARSFRRAEQSLPNRSVAISRLRLAAEAGGCADAAWYRIVIQQSVYKGCGTWFAAGP